MNSNTFYEYIFKILSDDNIQPLRIFIRLLKLLLIVIIIVFSECLLNQFNFFQKLLSIYFPRAEDFLKIDERTWNLLILFINKNEQHIKKLCIIN